MSAASRIVVKTALLGLLLIVGCCYPTVAQSTNNTTNNGDDLIWFNDVELWNTTNTSAPVRAPFRRTPRRRPVQKPRNVNTVSSANSNTTTSTATSSPTTIAPTTPKPSTPKPSTPKPSTPKPSTAKPTTPKPTMKPTVAPTTLAPTPAPTTKQPSVSPTVTPTTAAPTSQGTVQNLRMTMKYMTNTMDVFTQPTWENVTSTFVMNYWQNNNNNGNNLTVQGLHVTTLLVDQTSTATTRQRRQLQQQQENSVVYQQILSYTKLESSSTTDLETLQSRVATIPFETLTSRTQYVVQLQGTGNSAFQNLFTITPVVVSATDPATTTTSTNFFLQNWMWIAIGAAVVAVVLFVTFLCYFWKCRNKDNKKHGKKDLNTNNREDYFSGTNYYANGGTASQSPHAAQDDSTLNEPIPRLGMISSGCESLAGYGDQSVTTIDYDYTRAYGGGGGQSVVSSASATLGGWTNPGTTGGTTIAPREDNPTIFSDDDASYAHQPAPPVYAPPRPTTTIREELMDVICPPGKLGVVIDTPTEGPPQVHAIKDSSCVADKLRVGDKVVAVDQEDVRAMTAIKVSKMISRKSANPTRVLTILRVVDG